MLQVAHNLRAPLAASVSMLTLIDQGYLGDVTAEQKAYIMRIGSRLEGLDNLVGELLVLGRGRSPDQRPYEAVDPADLARRVNETFSSSAERSGIDLQIACDREAPVITGDAEMLAQLLENLVSNSVKYTPKGGHVSVEFRQSATGGLDISVRDSGIGIPVSEQAQLFSEFFRASNAKQAEADGTGLGLAIVKQVVDSHGGTIEVESAEDAGSLFRVTIPATPAVSA
jgi:signal transduction histidine kinase